MAWSQHSLSYHFINYYTGITMTQNERLVDYLANGNRIDPLTSWTELGIYRLSARVNEISKEIQVKRGWKTVVNQFGDKVKVREYWL